MVKYMSNFRRFHATKMTIPMIIFLFLFVILNNGKTKNKSVTAPIYHRWTRGSVPAPLQKGISPAGSR